MRVLKAGVRDVMTGRDAGIKRVSVEEVGEKMEGKIS